MSRSALAPAPKERPRACRGVRGVCFPSTLDRLAGSVCRVQPRPSPPAAVYDIPSRSTGSPAPASVAGTAVRAEAVREAGVQERRCPMRRCCAAADGDAGSSVSMDSETSANQRCGTRSALAVRGVSPADMRLGPGSVPGRIDRSTDPAACSGPGRAAGRECSFTSARSFAISSSCLSLRLVCRGVGSPLPVASRGFALLIASTAQASGTLRDRSSLRCKRVPRVRAVRASTWHVRYGGKCASRSNHHGGDVLSAFCPATRWPHSGTL